VAAFPPRTSSHSPVQAGRAVRSAAVHNLVVTCAQVFESCRRLRNGQSAGINGGPPTPRRRDNTLRFQAVMTQESARLAKATLGDRDQMWSGQRKVDLPVRVPYRPHVRIAYAVSRQHAADRKSGIVVADHDELDVAFGSLAQATSHNRDRRRCGCRSRPRWTTTGSGFTLQAVRDVQRARPAHLEAHLDHPREHR